MISKVVFSLMLVSLVSGTRGGPSCLVSITLYESGEWFTYPEIYLTCDNGGYLDLPLVDATYREHLFDPPRCFEEDLADDEIISCQIKEADYYFDDEIGYFTVRGNEFRGERIVGRQKDTFAVQLIREDDETGVTLT